MPWTVRGRRVILLFFSTFHRVAIREMTMILAPEAIVCVHYLVVPS